MTTARELLLTDLNYTIWANQLLLETASQLSEEELRRNLGASHKSVIRTLRHIYDAERSWVHNLMSNSMEQNSAPPMAIRFRPNSDFFNSRLRLFFVTEPQRAFLIRSWPKVCVRNPVSRYIYRPTKSQRAESANVTESP